MPVINLDVLLAVLIAAIAALAVVGVAWSRIRRRRPGSRLTSPAPAIQLDDRGVSLTPSRISRGSPSPATSETDPLGREIDRLTGLLGLTDWNRLVADEDVRHGRYKRPATVIVIELEGHDRLTAALGQIAADRVIVAVADIIHRHARKADHVARLGPSRFGVLLPETDEVAAINYVERVREAGDLWLESSAISMRLAIGWASPALDSSVVGAQAKAIERMLGEMLRGALRERSADPTSPDPVLRLKGAPSVA